MLYYLVCIGNNMFFGVYYFSVLFVYKQNTAYDMRIIDWGSDVCSSDLSIRNPIPPLVMFFCLTVAVIVSFLMLGVQSDPDIDFPGAIVIIAQPGAAPTELETQVTQRVEAAVRTIEGIDELNSTVTEGQSQTFVQFAIGTPIDRAVTDIRDKITQIRSNLPNGILEPQVIRLSTRSEEHTSELQSLMRISYAVFCLKQ